MRIIGLDTETTGLEPGSRPVEIAAVEYVEENGKLRSTSVFRTLVNPGMPIPADATKIHGIRDEDVVAAPFAPLAIERLVTFIGGFDDTTLVGHNISQFDCSVISWISQHYEMGCVLETLPIIDTLTLSRMHSGTKKHDLEFLVEHYGIARVGEAHRALSDAYAAGDLFRLFAHLEPSPGPWVTAWDYTREFPPGLENLPRWVAEGRPFTFEYEDAKGGMTERALIPYGWALKNDGVLYLSGMCQLRQERRTFRADRILTIVKEAA